tara:strand:+ start:4586 stop:5497 length:912 start_codon:yes stop_codon:yes gene_type:complete
MGMIGNQIAAGQALTIANDSFNGDGSTVVFTLSQIVGSVNDIEVLVDNVQQSPYDSSYSVSGTTLTFSGAPSVGTNNVYVIYNASRHITTSQVTPDDGSVHSSKIASNAVTDAKIAAMAASKLTGTIAEARMPSTIGFIVKGGTNTWQTGNQTGWYSMGTGTTNSTSASRADKGVIDFSWASATNYPGNFGGTNFNATTGVFTAPSAGYYMFGLILYADLGGGATGDPFLHTLSIINGNSMSDYGMHGRTATVATTMDSPQYTHLYYLNANDTYENILYLNEHPKTRVYPLYSYQWGLKINGT